ncbi:hypothetical protein B296_00028971, partial [Ensete ventricosum]
VVSFLCRLPFCPLLSPLASEPRPRLLSFAVEAEWGEGFLPPLISLSPSRIPAPSAAAPRSRAPQGSQFRSVYPLGLAVDSFLLPSDWPRACLLRLICRIDGVLHSFLMWLSLVRSWAGGAVWDVGLRSILVRIWSLEPYDRARMRNKEIG